MTDKKGRELTEVHKYDSYLQELHDIMSIEISKLSKHPSTKQLNIVYSLQDKIRLEEMFQNA